MKRPLRRIRPRDRRFLAFVLMNALFIAAYTAAGLQAERVQAGGWRRIDVGALKARIRDGTLVDREAEWYRVWPEGPDP